MTVLAGILISKQVAFSARLRCVSITPLLFPVVPDVNMIVQSWSGLISLSKVPACSPSNFQKDSAWSSLSSCCMEIKYFSFGQRSFTIAATSLRISSRTRTVTSARSISSHISSAGRETSSGTATLPLLTVPR